MNRRRYLIIIDVLIVLVGIIFAIAFKGVENYEYLVGFIIGFGAIMIVGTIIGFYIRKTKGKNYEYDERQIARRGECYKYAVISLAVTLILDGVIRQAFNYEWSSYLIGVSVNLVIALTVFVISAIFKDAYFFEERNMIKLIILFFALGVVNIIFGLIDCFNGEFIVDGMVTASVTNMLVGVMSVLIATCALIKRAIDNKTDSEDYEES